MVWTTLPRALLAFNLEYLHKSHYNLEAETNRITMDLPAKPRNLFLKSCGCISGQSSRSVTSVHVHAATQLDGQDD